ncbi:MAG: acyl-CoA dehydratase activase [Oscillospiraceae bacterium]|nr:acyl-CoA dehydratase activase [Oscillospiraceae bacterium]
MTGRTSLGVDVGSVSTKGVVIDGDGNLLAEAYIATQADPIGAAKQIVASLEKQLGGGVKVESVGVTGSARRLIGAMLGANAVKNEITAHAVGALARHPGVRTILEIGGQDSKIILIKGGVVVDYAMNTLCAAGTGAFLSSQAARMGMRVEEIAQAALRARHPAKIAARCTVFAESDLVHKAQAGHSKDDLMAGLCQAVVANYLSNVGKGKQIRPPIVFQGGVSKNGGVVRAFEEALSAEIHVDSDSHLMGAVGAAVLASKAQTGVSFDFQVSRRPCRTTARECAGCANRCEIVTFFAGQLKIDSWGAKCEKGSA